MRLRLQFITHFVIYFLVVLSQENQFKLTGEYKQNQVTGSNSIVQIKDTNKQVIASK